MPGILIVDDDEVFCSRVVRALSSRGFDARGVRDYDAAIAMARSWALDMAVVDLRLPGRSGLDVVRDLKALSPKMAIVVLTGYGSIATAIESLRLGAVDYLSKPVDVDQIVAAFGISPLTHEAARETDVPSLARVEWEHIQRVLTDCGGNISAAARLLGLHRRSLQRKLAKFPAPR
ncbi:MAG TPA: response regulator [Candidatus Nitrosotalea sp.]|nr:response regulator [Candidatus Nitrosotalea sp.]